MYTKMLRPLTFVVVLVSSMSMIAMQDSWNQAANSPAGKVVGKGFDVAHGLVYLAALCGGYQILKDTAKLAYIRLYKKDKSPVTMRQRLNALEKNNNPVDIDAAITNRLNALSNFYVSVANFNALKARVNKMDNQDDNKQNQ